jgi:aryl-alcohol dehydrogenase-like predicted oxidoreductase
VLAHSVLAYGLLCGHWAPDKEFPEGDHRSERWTIDEFRRRLRQLDALRPVVGGAVLTLRAGALRYVLSTPAVSSAVIGPRNTLQLDQLVREAGKEPPYLSDQQLTALAARLRDAGVES